MRARVAALLLVVAAPAVAHEVGISRGTYVVTADGIDAEVVFARQEAHGALAQLPADVLYAAPGCDARTTSATDVEGDGIAIRVELACRASPPSLDTRFFTRVAPSHRHFAHVVAADGAVHDVVVAAADPVVLLTTTAPTHIVAFFTLGVEHILTGFDHLVFLLGVLVVGGRFRSLLGVITAFTIAHSITLALAVLGVFAPPPRVIEPLIALSIAYVGLENFFVADAQKRWRLTAAFGLIHGFGFAGALAEVGMPRDDVPLALLLFNGGVEVGQLAVLAVALPLLWQLQKARWFQSRGKKAISAVVVVLGVGWFVQRLWG